MTVFMLYCYKKTAFNVLSYQIFSPLHIFIVCGFEQFSPVNYGLFSNLHKQIHNQQMPINFWGFCGEREKTIKQLICLSFHVIDRIICKIQFAFSCLVIWCKDLITIPAIISALPADLFLENSFTIL